MEVGLVLHEDKCTATTLLNAASLINRIADKAKRSALVGSDREVSDLPGGNAIWDLPQAGHECVKIAIILLRFDWLPGLIGALLW
jgi:hypothetical protein